MKKLLSTLICLVVMLSLISTFSVFPTNAASDVLQMTNDTTYNVVWDADTVTKNTYLTVDETGYYDLEIKDQLRTSTLWVYVYDLDIDENVLDINCVDLSKHGEDEDHLYKNIRLVKGHLYQVDFEYDIYDYDDYISQPANILVNFKKNAYVPTKLTVGSAQNAAVKYNETLWIEFKTSVSGDYIVEVNNEIDTFVIFEKNTGLFVRSCRFYDVLKSRVNLKANTDYVVYVDSNDESSKIVKFEVSKAANDVTNIEVENPDTILADNGYIYSDGSYLYDSVVESLDYIVTFNNNTSGTFTYNDLYYEGIDVYVYYTGDIYSYGDESFFTPGKQPVVIEYMNNVSNGYVYISTYLEWLESIRVTADYEDMYIEYENEEEQEYFWRIKPSENNMYEFYSTDWDQITCDITIFDKNNHVVPLTNDGWKLTGGTEYSLRIRYTYNEYCYDDVVFTLEPYRNHVHSGNYVYNNDATATMDGTKTRTCSVCGYKETVIAVGTKWTSSFTDIKTKDFYYVPTLWAVANNITTGTSKTTFSPEESCTRGQVVTFLWRAAGCPEPKTTTMPFTDVGSKAFYKKAVLWAVEQGITSGTSATTFGPNETCTRGQIATFLWRAKGKPAPKSSNMPFVDVAAKNFAYKAVLWAVENKITSGTSKTTFAPSEPCTRGQIVTFLYRAYK